MDIKIFKENKKSMWTIHGAMLAPGLLKKKK